MGTSLRPVSWSSTESDWRNAMPMAPFNAASAVVEFEPSMSTCTRAVRARRAVRGVKSGGICRPAYACPRRMASESSERLWTCFTTRKVWVFTKLSMN